MKLDSCRQNSGWHNIGSATLGLDNYPPEAVSFLNIAHKVEADPSYERLSLNILDSASIRDKER